MMMMGWSACSVLVIVAESVADSLRMYLTHCFNSAITLIAGVLVLRPKRKGIPCRTVTDPAKAPPEGLGSPDKVLRVSIIRVFLPLDLMDEILEIYTKSIAQTLTDL